MRTLPMSLTALAALALVACGGEPETRTVVETVTAPPPPGAPAPDPSTAPAPPPEGAVVLEGTYAMETNEADYEGENIAVDDEFPTESEWVFATDCTGPTCTVRMRRELGSGAFKTLTLQPVEGRPGVFAGESTGTTGCVTEQKAETQQRYSIKLNAPQPVEGRPTATRIDAYFTEETDGCELTDRARGIVSWKGTLLR